MKRKTVLVGGCFDILHFGHIHFLKEAKKHGDYLIVALDSDEGVAKLKGEGRPIHSEKQRKESLEALRFVDEVFILPKMDGYQDYEKMVVNISPQIIAVTVGDPQIKNKTSQAEKVGAKIVEISKIRSLSTTKIAKLLGLE